MRRPTAWVFGNEVWHETAASDPRKVLAQEVFSTVSARIPFISQNGSGKNSLNGGVWSRISRRKGNDKGESEKA